MLNLAKRPSLAVNGPLYWNDEVGDHGSGNNHWKAIFWDHAFHALGANAGIVGVRTCSKPADRGV